MVCLASLNPLVDTLEYQLLHTDARQKSVEVLEFNPEDRGLSSVESVFMALVRVGSIGLGKGGERVWSSLGSF